MTNDEMKPGRFLRMQQTKRLYAAIVKCFSLGGRVQVCTHLRATTYPTLDYFKAGKTSVYVRRGKSWDCIDYCAVRLFE